MPRPKSRVLKKQVELVVSQRSRSLEDLSDFGICIPVSEHALLLLPLLFSLSHSKSEF
jgi:hypothetical protein